MNEIERRLFQAREGRRNLHDDYLSACEEVKRAHEAFKQSGLKGKPTPAAQDRYARALRELDIATRCFRLSEAA